MNNVVLYFVSYLDIPALFYLQNVEEMSVISWLLVPLLICIDLLSRKYHVIPDSQITLALAIHADLVIFEPVNLIQHSSFIYDVTSYVNLTPYLNSLQ